VDGERVISRLSTDQFQRLEQLPKDQWPGR